MFTQARTISAALMPLLCSIIHCGTNDLKTEKDHGIIADNILGLAHQCKTDSNTVMISGVMT